MEWFFCSYYYSHNIHCKTTNNVEVYIKISAKFIFQKSNTSLFILQGLWRILMVESKCLCGPSQYLRALQSVKSANSQFNFCSSCILIWWRCRRFIRGLPIEAGKWRNRNRHIFGASKLNCIEMKDRKNKSVLIWFVKIKKLTCNTKLSFDIKFFFFL